ncbi:hypothetical protein [Stenotrophomonas sp. MB339]|nr:hypothetical protein [Stenotrophomonas sp. MB339]
MWGGAVAVAGRRQPGRLLERDASHASLAAQRKEVTALFLEACAAIAG